MRAMAGVLLVVVLLAGCSGPSITSGEYTQVAWVESPPIATPSEVGSTGFPDTPGLATAVPDVGQQATPSPGLTTSELARFQPDELGRVPVLMYHALVYDTKDLDEWSITPEQFTAQLE